MEEKTSLLEQLRIDRGEDEGVPRQSALPGVIRPDGLSRAERDRFFRVGAAASGGASFAQSTAGDATPAASGASEDTGHADASSGAAAGLVHPGESGQAAVVRLNAYPDWAIPAQVVAIIPTADQSKATVKVRVGFKARDARILPEMGARVSFLAKRGESS